MAQDNVTCSIGAWGPKSAGKTIYLWMCYHLLDSTAAMRRRGWKFSRLDDQTRDLLAMLSTQIKNSDPDLPTSTSERTIYNFNVQGYGRFGLGKLKAKVRFSDWPGETLNRAAPDTDFYRELSHCHAIMCFIDPHYKDQDDLVRGVKAKYGNTQSFYGGELENLINRLKPPAGTKAPQTIAVVITKIDSREVYWEKRHDPRALLCDIIGQNATEFIENNCEKYRIFPCSSVGPWLDATGAWKGSNLVEKPGGGEGRYQFRDLHKLESLQFGVVDPFVWVLEQTKWRRMWGKLPSARLYEVAVEAPA